MLLINEPVKVAYQDGKLLLEVHPPVDAEGQTLQYPDIESLAPKLRHALGHVGISVPRPRGALELAPNISGPTPNKDAGPLRYSKSILILPIDIDKAIATAGDRVAVV
jgi:hypothetical protein